MSQDLEDRISTLEEQTRVLMSSVSQLTQQNDELHEQNKTLTAQMAKMRMMYDPTDKIGRDERSDALDAMRYAMKEMLDRATSKSFEDALHAQTFGPFDEPSIKGINPRIIIEDELSIKPIDARAMAQLSGQFDVAVEPDRKQRRNFNDVCAELKQNSSGVLNKDVVA